MALYISAICGRDLRMVGKCPEAGFKMKRDYWAATLNVTENEGSRAR